MQAAAYVQQLYKVRGKGVRDEKRHLAFLMNVFIGFLDFISVRIFDTEKAANGINGKNYG